MKCPSCGSSKLGKPEWVGRRRNYYVARCLCKKAFVFETEAQAQKRTTEELAVVRQPAPKPVTPIPRTNVFFHTGDIGDCIAALPAIRAMGGGELRIGYRADSTEKPMFGRESMKGVRFNVIRPLLEAQDYIRGVSWAESEDGVTHDISTFRTTIKPGPKENLAHWQARHLGIPISLDPWLTVAPSQETRGRVIFARSPRCANPWFPWFDIVKRFPDALFIGMPSEHRDFQQMFSPKRAVEYRPTANLLELAELIAGCKLFIGNQSCPFWIAAGLGVNLIQETWPNGPNSIVERRNARYTEGRPYELSELGIA